MSSQKGNACRMRPQKHHNSKVFNNLRYDTNHRSAQIVKTEVVQVSHILFLSLCNALFENVILNPTHTLYMKNLLLKMANINLFLISFSGV